MTQRKSMIAATQYQLSPADLQVLLAMARTGTLSAAGDRLGVDASTVFRSVQRIERGLGQPLFQRSRSGWLPSELGQALAAHAETIEAAVEAARAEAQLQPQSLSGSVRITSTDTVMHGLVAPALAGLRKTHPLLGFDLSTSNELASLTRRDADIAVRATKRPPAHLVGRPLGPIRVALYASRKGGPRRFEDVDEHCTWIGIDDVLPEHPSVLWRRRHFPKAQPLWRASSLLTALELVALGLGIGVLPMFLAHRHAGLRPLSSALDDAQTDLWLLTHPQTRHLRRVAAVYAHLGEALVLP
jgi:DNA-binding transcriptional LysR family regulator